MRWQLIGIATSRRIAICLAEGLSYLAGTLNLVEVLEVTMAEALNIMDTAIRSGIFQTFTRLLEGSALERELRCGTSYTLFAPADIAFAYIPAETLNQLLQAERQGVLADVLSYHAVPGKIMIAELKDLASVKTVYGEHLIVKNAPELRIEGARVLETDIEAWNGFIHAIDRLLLPTRPATSASA